MGVTVGLLKQFGKPEGMLGRLVGWAMNFGHRRLRRWALSHVYIKTDDYVLDVGCGGGKTVKVLARTTTSGKAYGVDYSEDMVHLARKVNRKFVGNGRVKVLHGSVSFLPFPDDLFDLVTAFETYYFWPSLIDDLKEVKRVLKPGGKFLLANEMYKDERFEKRNTRLASMLDIQYHTPEEYNQFLTEAGYSEIKISNKPEKNWIMALAG